MRAPQANTPVVNPVCPNYSLFPELVISEKAFTDGDANAFPSCSWSDGEGSSRVVSANPAAVTLLDVTGTFVSVKVGLHSVRLH